MVIKLKSEAYNKIKFTDDKGANVEFYRYRCRSADKADTDIYLINSRVPLPETQEFAFRVSQSRSKYPGIVELSGEI